MSIAERDLLRELAQWNGIEWRYRDAAQRRREASVEALKGVLAAFLDEWYDPSPYSPVSRLFWNEFYIDLTLVPELQSCRAAREFLASAKFMARLEECRRERWVDYRGVMALKRRALELVVAEMEKSSWPRESPFGNFLRDCPQVTDYARFRAALERTGKAWLDHVMGLHRLYWVPRGLSAADGTYVHYRSAEWYALFALEASKAKAWLVGENLGTVPPEVNAALREHRIGEMYVLQYELRPAPARRSWRCLRWRICGRKPKFKIFPGREWSIRTGAGRCAWLWKKLRVIRWSKRR